MSGHGDPVQEAHGDEHDHTPGDEHHAPPAPEEPATPLWFTLLGVAIFLVVGILLAAWGPEGKTTAELTAEPGAGADSPPPGTPAPAAAPNPAARGNGAPNLPHAAQPAVRP